MNRTVRIVSVVEAKTINAVAKVVLAFYRTAREMARETDDTPTVEGSVITFDRRPNSAEAPNEFVLATRASEIEIDVIAERRRFDLSVIQALRSIVEQRQPDIVVTHSVKSHFLLWRSGLWQRFPWIAFHHGYTATDRKMRIYNRLDRWSLPKADRVITVCQAFARELASSTGLPPERFLVQHNAIQPQLEPNAGDVQELRSRLGLDEKERIILSIGRLSKEKAQIDLIGAFAALCESNPEIKASLVIVGDGPEFESLRSAAQASKHGERIIFTGQVNNVQSFYSIADVFVLSSHSEGSPNVLLEAMADNVPVVATAVGGVPEIVENNESALLVAAKDPTAMAAAILRLLTDRDLAQRLTARASELVIKQHSPEEYVQSLVTLYREVIDRRSSVL